MYCICNFIILNVHSVYAFDRVLLELKMESTESAAARRDNKLSYDVFSITFESISLVHKMHEMLEGIYRSHREHLYKHELEILEDSLHHSLPLTPLSKATSHA